MGTIAEFFVAVGEITKEDSAFIVAPAGVDKCKKFIRQFAKEQDWDTAIAIHFLVRETRRWLEEEDEPEFHA
jgi:hypothetical protein